MTIFIIIDEGDYYRLLTNEYNLTYNKDKIDFLKEFFSEWLEQTSKKEEK